MGIKYSGRNNKENDEISFKKAKDGDIWLHVVLDHMY